MTTYIVDLTAFRDGEAFDFIRVEVAPSSEEAETQAIAYIAAHGFPYNETYVNRTEIKSS